MLGEEEPRTGWSAIGGRRQRGWSVPKQVCGEVLLAKEQDTRKGGLFAATPPNHGSTRKVMLLDVSKAHLYTPGRMKSTQSCHQRNGKRKMREVDQHALRNADCGEQLGEGAQQHLR